MDKFFDHTGSSERLEASHLSNFVAAVRSRKAGDLAARALQGHLSAACCHMANISYQLGQQSASEAIIHDGRSTQSNIRRTPPGVFDLPPTSNPSSLLPVNRKDLNSDEQYSGVTNKRAKKQWNAQSRKQ
jgi:hypothetical protein